MYSFRSIFACLVLAGVTPMLEVPVLAQFEVAPDHFTDAQQPTVIGDVPPSQRLNRDIAAVQQELEGYYRAIDRQRESVEHARELASGSGAMGDAVSIFIDEYAGQQRELDRLKRELAPQIVLAQIRLAALTHAQTATAVPQRPAQGTSVITRRRTHRSAVLVASAPKPRK
jgi:hypothetical protein